MQKPGVMLLRIAGVAAVVAVCALAWQEGFVQALRWPSLVAHHAIWAAAAARHPVLAPLAFVGIYMAAVAMSLPVGLWLSLIGGMFFGIWLGGLLTLAGASAGAVALFLLARGLLAPLFTGRFDRQISRLQPGLQRDGFNYLLALRLMPVFPFWLVNLAPALLGMRLRSYALATVLGMIPSTFILNAVGAGLRGTMDSGAPPSMAMLLRPAILLPLVALAVVALLPPLWREWRRRSALQAGRPV